MIDGAKQKDNNNNKTAKYVSIDQRIAVLKNQQTKIENEKPNRATTLIGMLCDYSMPSWAIQINALLLSFQLAHLHSLPTGTVICQ